MLGDEHDQAFTVAKMMDTDLLHTVKGRLDKALAKGTTLAEFKKDLIPQLQKAGWWGKQDMIDPLTGDVVSAQLGSASRLENIFRTNLQGAYAAGHWQAIESQAKEAPFLLYDAVDDGRTRPEHAAMDGTLLPVGHPWFDTHSPSNGYNCRCGLIQLDAEQMKAHGLKFKQPPQVKSSPWKNPRTGITRSVPDDLDPGWDHNPGKARMANLRKVEQDKLRTLTPGERRAWTAGNQAMATLRKQARDSISDSLDAPAIKGSADANMDQKTVRALVNSAAFGSWLERPEGEYPVGVLSRELADSLGTQTTLVMLSDQTANTKRVARKGRGIFLWRMLPDIIQKGIAIKETGGALVIYFAGKNDTLYKAVIKTTRLGELYVTTTHRATERNLRISLGKGEVIREGR